VTEDPVLHQYQMSDRAEILDFIREVFPAPVIQRLIAQWTWMFEAGPLTPPSTSFGSAAKWSD
jgi:hypothetical protein